MKRPTLITIRPPNPTDTDENGTSRCAVVITNLKSQRNNGFDQTRKRRRMSLGNY